MPSDLPPDARFMQVAKDLVDRARREAFGASARGAAPGTGASETTGGTNDRASGAADLARTIAELILHAANQIAAGVVEGGEQLESVLARRPAAASTGQSKGGGDHAGRVPAPVALMLPDVSPGQASSAELEVRNDSRDALDAFRVTCGGLFGAGGVRIAAQHVALNPPAVDVAPRRTVSVECKVTVPADAKRGHYIGLIEAPGSPGAQLLVSLHVI